MDQNPPQVGLEQLQVALAAGLPLLDVRELDEFETARVPEAVLVPLMNVPAELEAITTLAAGGPLYVICAAGGRSNRAAAFLRGQGIDAINVAGGTYAWVGLELPTASGPISSGTS
jgi:rhodanese-related sulfurtransferase